MGRVKGSNVKRMTKQIVAKFPGQFGTNFTANKHKLKAMGLKMDSKIEMNKLAGEITVATKKVKNREKAEESTA